MSEVSLLDVMQELRDLRVMVQKAFAPAQESRPLSAEELLERWQIPGKTMKDRLHLLARKCRDRGLKPMEGTRGLSATYGVSDVIRAEAYAQGKLRSRPRRVA